MKKQDLKLSESWEAGNNCQKGSGVSDIIPVRGD